MTSAKKVHALQEAIWNGSLPLEIRLASTECRIYDQADPFLIHYPRLSYLPFLLPRLHAFFLPFLIQPDVAPHEGWFSFEEIPLKWHYAVGLLFDLFSGATPSSSPTTLDLQHHHIRGGGGGSDDGLPDEEEDNGEGERKSDPLPWRLTIHFSAWPDEQLVRLDAEGRVLHDAFINSVKEADFLRNGTAKGIMALSKDDSTQLWTAVQEQNLSLFLPIFQKLLHAQGAPLRHTPIKIYLPSPSPAPPPSPSLPPTSPSSTTPSAAHLRVVQSPIPPIVAGSREPQTLGSALHGLIPALFPSRRTPILAQAVLHGAVVPLGAGVEELVRWAPYADGWVHLGVVMMG